MDATNKEFGLVCGTCNKPLINKQKKWCSTFCKNRHSNHKHQVYTAQQARGLKRKKKLVELLGGQCKECGYKKNYSSLSFHHVDPSLKEIGLDLRACSNNSWEVLLKEAGKCELLCLNCHSELHNPDLLL